MRHDVMSIHLTNSYESDVISYQDVQSHWYPPFFLFNFVRKISLRNIYDTTIRLSNFCALTTLIPLA